MPNPVKILFICTMNKIRSLSAEHVYQHDPRFEVKSAGTDDFAHCPVQESHLSWADRVIVMEDFHRIKLKRQFPDFFPSLTICSLDIPDAYKYMEPALVKTLQEKFEYLYTNQWKSLTMRLEEYIQHIQIHLIQTHHQVLQWFLEDEQVLQGKPKDGGWSIAEILEHIALTSHFLLILIDKGAKKALKNIHKLSLEQELQQADFNLDKLEAIGIHKSFHWVRPEHMEPQGEITALKVKNMLIDQLRKCLDHLESLKNGEGLLYSTTMTVHNLGKIHAYEYIYFLSKHAERHLTQMEENKNEFFNPKQ